MSQWAGHTPAAWPGEPGSFARIHILNRACSVLHSPRSLPHVFSRKKLYGLAQGKTDQPTGDEVMRADDQARGRRNAGDRVGELQCARSLHHGNRHRARLDGLASMWDHGTTPCSIFHREVFSVGALNSSAHAMVHPAASQNEELIMSWLVFSSVRGRLPSSPAVSCALAADQIYFRLDSLVRNSKFGCACQVHLSPAEKRVAMLVPIDMNRLPR